MLVTEDVLSDEIVALLQMSYFNEVIVFIPDDVVFDEVVGDAITKINPSEALKPLIMEQKGDLFDNTLQGQPMSHYDGLFDDTVDLYDYLYNTNAV